jgi:AcrR family transcriptional regulator
MKPPETRTAATGRRPAELSVARIVGVATGITEAEGFEALSMRRIADEFGVTAMALYGYVETKRQLLELIADQYMSQLDLAEEAQPLSERLFRIFRSFHALTVERPLLAHVLTTQTVDGPAAHRMAEAVLGVLRDHGFADEDAVEVFSVLASFVIGFTVSQRARMSGPDTRNRLRRLRAAPDHPNLSAVAEQYLDWPKSRAFENGLRHLIHAYVSTPT